MAIFSALIMAGASIAGGIIGQQAALANKKAVRKAAIKNYNTMMGNSREMESKVYENMTSYQRDAAEYKSNMIAARSAMGGVRTVNDNQVQKEVLDYEFDIDKIDYEKEGYKKIDGYEMAGKSYRKYQQKNADAAVDERNNEVLYNALMNYQGKQATFSTPSTSALAVEQQSVKELQKDLNETYKQGMQEVLHQRQAAQNSWQQMAAQGEMYEIQGMQSLWNGLLGAGTSLVQSYGQYKSSLAESQWRSQQLAAYNRIAAGLEGLQGGR